MLNEMMGDPEKDYVIHWWKFDCDEFDFYSGYEWQVNCPKCKQRLTPLAPDAVDSVASSGIVNASAESTSQAEPTPTQRG